MAVLRKRIRSGKCMKSSQSMVDVYFRKRINKMRIRGSIVAVCVLASGMFSLPSLAGTEVLFAPKVIVLTAFPPEWHAWKELKPYHYKSIKISGLIRPLLCNQDGVCVTETGEGEINAAVSVASLAKDHQLDVRKTIFIRSGIAGGVDQADSPLGSVYINDWVISWAFGHHYLANNKTLAWSPPGCDNYAKNFAHPTDCANYAQNSLENLAYRINPRLLALAEDAARNIKLQNDAAAISLDEKFHLQKQPKVLVGATITGDDFWIGKENQEIAEKIVKLYTQGTGHYTNTAMEDLGDVAALSRFGLADHYLSIRGISDVDVPPPGETEESIWAKGDLYAGELAEQNAVLATQAIIKKILSIKGGI
ncbi:phosphorylase [Acidithiobacillus sp. IBUN Pt1247-S3]|uniref:phosphorylase family protein n=1 Tax=Acidithiobacillus sp. IBUN Pt1247-S3 TaxID=3166642 RepID=UPI0034E5272C